MFANASPLRVPMRASPSSLALVVPGRYHPAQPQHPEGQPAMPEADANTRPVVLVVDDEPELRSLLIEYLGRHGFTVRSAANAAEARELILAGVPDLALLDVNMPGENGLSLARWMRESHPRIGW